jgi:hypothetical protein
VLKAKPDLLEGTVAKLWSRFFCLSVYITMYLNDNQRSAFYESIGMNTKLVGDGAGRGPGRGGTRPRAHYASGMKLGELRECRV